MLTVGHCATLSTFLYASKRSYKKFEKSNTSYQYLWFTTFLFKERKKEHLV